MHRRDPSYSEGLFECRHMDNGQRVQLQHCLQMNLQNDTAVLTDSEYSVDMFLCMSRSLSNYFSKSESQVGHQPRTDSCMAMWETELCYTHSKVAWITKGHRQQTETLLIGIYQISIPPPRTGWHQLEPPGVFTPAFCII